jgi:nitrate/TMAO reductase-like tetraheme cytochrome c subunit
MDRTVSCSSCHSTWVKAYQAIAFYKKPDGEYYRTCSQCHTRKSNKVNEKNQAAKKNIIANIMTAFNNREWYTKKEIEYALNNYDKKN